MSIDTQHQLTSRFDEQRRSGMFRLRFVDLVEDEFRRAYAEASYPKTRPILVIGTGLVCLALLSSVLEKDVSLATAGFTLAILLPTLLGALVCTYKEGAQESYQTLLALSASWIGLVCTSLTARASLHGMPYFFGALVAWIFVVWLVLGLQFWRAAVTAVTLSAVYGWGMFHWHFDYIEVVFSAVTLFAVNLMGAYCCFQLESAVRKAFFESRMLNELAERDGLTGLYNRRRYDENIEKIWRLSRRDQNPFTVMLIDIDHFKAFNDYYGHQAGDDALKRVADVIALYAQRPLDFAARYGGEEFALVLYGSAHEQAREIPEQLRRAVEDMKVPHAESTAGPYLTVSIGVAVVSPGTERSLTGAIQMADEALYQAKEEGRNRVVIKESRHTHIQTGRFRAARMHAAR